MSSDDFEDGIGTRPMNLRLALRERERAKISVTIMQYRH